MQKNVTLQIIAPAKVNLGLRVLNRRADGYHNIDSVFQTVSLSDRLTISQSDHLHFTTSGQWQVPTGDDNLVVRAVCLLCEKLKIDPYFTIHLEKSIPPGGGLGGGSSDAVAALVGCNELLGSPLNTDELTTLAAKIGSDCPFFLRGGLQHASGRGDILRPLTKTIEGAFGVWFPGMSVSTADAYRSLNRGLTQVESSLILYDCFLSTCDWWNEDEVVNDFELVVAPKIVGWHHAVEHWLTNGARWVALTGSGSCQVAFFTGKADCEKACAAWQLKGMVWATTPVSEGIRIVKVGET